MLRLDRRRAEQRVGFGQYYVGNIIPNLARRQLKHSFSTDINLRPLSNRTPATSELQAFRRWSNDT